MDIWDQYPVSYRAKEVEKISQAVRAGECVAIIGLSGAGKSNLLGFLTHRRNLDPAQVLFILVDCNQLKGGDSEAFFYLVNSSILKFLSETPKADRDASESERLIENLESWFQKIPRICLLLDRFDGMVEPSNENRVIIFNNLRALRDRFKYRLTYIIASRQVMSLDSELAELFFAHTFWLGPLGEDDSLWSISQYAERKGKPWNPAIAKKIYQLSWGYPSLLRAVCEAFADGCPLELGALSRHPTVLRRVQEFWSDNPSEEAIRLSGLAGQPFLEVKSPAKADFDHELNDLETDALTGKEYLLFKHLITHAGEVCDKDDLIRAVWPEDKIYSDGIRDESLAQLIRRLRKKIEADPSHPDRIQTVAGRGYRFILHG